MFFSSPCYSWLHSSLFPIAYYHSWASKLTKSVFVVFWGAALPEILTLLRSPMPQSSYHVPTKLQTSVKHWPIRPGIFTFVFTASDTAVYDPRNCSVQANLPGGNCTITPPMGVLTASINLVNYSILSFLAFLNYTTGTFLPSIFP